MTLLKVVARYPNEIGIAPGEVLGKALDGEPMILIVIDGVAFAIPYNVAYTLAKAIRRIVKDKPNEQA